MNIRGGVSFRTAVLASLVVSTVMLPTRTFAQRSGSATQGPESGGPGIPPGALINGEGIGGLGAPRMPAEDRIGRIQMTVRRVDGLLSRESVMRVLRRNQPALTFCYASALRTNPNVQGLMVMRIAIGGDGAVTGVEEAANYVRDATLSSCINGRLRTIQFPSTEDRSPVNVLVQMRFRQTR